MRELGAGELIEAVDDPFVRHQVDPAHTRTAWEHDGAVVIAGARPLPGSTGEVVTALGPAAALARLLPRVAEATALPQRVTVPVHAADVLPPVWRHTQRRRWHWMLTRTAPPTPALDVVEVVDDDEVDALLDAVAPDAHARPGSPGVECWLGVRDGARLVAVGALARQADGTGHLRAVTVVPEARGRGLGSGLSAALTRRALERGSGVATLGVYVDNSPAVAVYRRLGFEVVHTFASGPVSR